MTRTEFDEFCRNRLIYLDGATGSNLVKAGMPSGACPEKWILEHREVMLSLQKEYVRAGSNILYAPTFTANRVKLSEYGLEKELMSMNRELAAISREAAAFGKERVYVAGDLTMTGKQLRPAGNMELEELIDIYKEQILALEAAGVDLLVAETMMSLGEARAALIAAKEVSRLPVMVTMTFERDGRTLFGTDAKTAAIVLESLGACAVGANCSAGPDQMQEIIEQMAEVTRLPIIAKPNAGLPYLDQAGNTCYSMESEEFADKMALLIQKGASVLGGCCGTSPEYIEKLKENQGTEITAKVQRRQPGMRYLTSERKALGFSLDTPFILVGERINPTGKRLLQAQLREGVFDRVLAFAQEQEEDGAQILDINMGMSGIDEKAMMLQAIEEVTGITSLPLSIDSSSAEVVEAALRAYPGRALINSISLEKEKFEKLLPVAAKYGAMFILLPLSDKGLPENIEEKKQIINTIYEKALSLGLCMEDIVVDGLVTTVGANKRAALETLETIRYCRERGFATICGLSNISFGMPERGFVNTAFLTLAIKEGLTMAIANPSQQLLAGCALAADLLLAKEEADLRYIEYAGRVKEEASLAVEKASVAGSKKTPEAPAPERAVENSCRDSLRNGILKGSRKGIVQLTQNALQSGEKPEALLNEVLLPAINTVGEYFDKGKYFLPQLIASAEAMKSAVELLEPLLLKEQKGENMPVAVMATVEGDIHDIGKNLVVLMLKNYGFQVIDLGKDVPKEKIIRAAKEHNAQLIGLSALMTTTMQRMREVIEYAASEGVHAKIMIGGAVITQEYADEIGADGYSKDAAEAVRLAKRLTAGEGLQRTDFLE